MATTALEELRKEARKLESTIDLKLVNYSKFGANLAHASFLREEDRVGGISDSEESLLSNSEHVSLSMALEIEQLLSRLSEINDRMGRCTHSVTLPHILQHHRGKLLDYTQEFKKTKAHITSTREKAELLGSLRDNTSQCNKSSALNSRTTNLLRERTSIHESSAIVDQMLGQAQDTKEEITTQRNILQGTINKLADVGGSIPGINSIIADIRRRKSRDCLILGFFISFCVCFLLFYWLRS
jgi:Golgi SNAP receptor complex protein 1